MDVRTYSEAMDRLLDARRWLAGSELDQDGDVVTHRQKLHDMKFGLAAWPEVFIDLLDDGLAHSSPFYVAPEICEMVSSAAEHLPNDVVLRPEMLPVGSGFCYFSRPIPLEPTLLGEDGKVISKEARDRVCDKEISINAVSWSTALVPDLETGDPPGIFVCLYLTSRESSYGPTPLPTMNAAWGFGESLRFTFDVRLPSLGLPESLLGSWELSLRTCAALLLFLEQRLAVTGHSQVHKDVRKRAERAGLDLGDEPTLRVITYRRPKQRSTDPETFVEVDWSCRWWVRGHWHKYWLKDDAGHRTVESYRWLTPYVKGPDDKPLKQARTDLFAVIR